MNREIVNKTISYIGGFLCVVLFFLCIYCIWNFSYFLLKINLTLLWTLIAIYFLESNTK